MRAVVQRVREAQVWIADQLVAEIGLGLLVLVGVAEDDGEAEARWMAGRLMGLRVFADEQGKLGRSVRDVGGSLCVVSQFTLYGDVSRGFRPDFRAAAPAHVARPVYEHLVSACRAAGVPVATGVFGAEMDVRLVNWGPVTIQIERSKGGTA